MRKLMGVAVFLLATGIPAAGGDYVFRDLGPFRALWDINKHDRILMSPSDGEGMAILGNKKRKWLDPDVAFFGLNDHGDLTGGVGENAIRITGHRGMDVLPFYGGVGYRGIDINNSGVTLVRWAWYLPAEDPVPYSTGAQLWWPDGRCTPLEMGYRFNEAAALSEENYVAGTGYEYDFEHAAIGFHAMLSDPGGWRQLVPLPYHPSWASNIDGPYLVGTADTGGVGKGFVWNFRTNEWAILPSPPEGGSHWANDVSARQQLIVGAFYDVLQRKKSACIWEMRDGEITVMNLGALLGEAESEALAVTERGTILGIFSVPPGPGETREEHIALWEPRGH